MGLADPVFEVKLTPNRPDCTGVRGIARDLAAAGLGTLKPERGIAGVEGSFDCPIDIKLEFSEGGARRLPVFAGRYIKGVSNGAVAGLAAAAPQGGGPAAHQRAGRRHQLHQPRSRPAAARLRRRQAEGRHPRTPRHATARNSPASTARRTRSTRPCASSPTTAPRWASAASSAARRRAARDATENVLIESAYFDPLRTAATGRKAGLAERRPLPLRARRRSAVHAARPRSRHRDDAGDGRRQAVKARSPAPRPRPRPSSVSHRHRSRSSAASSWRRSRSAPRWSGWASPSTATAQP